MSKFSETKSKYDGKYESAQTFDCFLPVHLKLGSVAVIKNKAGEKNEEYYKWQFLYSIVHGGLFSKDFLGTEIHFPKGNKNSASIKFDAAIFDDAGWFAKYSEYHNSKSLDALDWLRQHLLVAIEIKKEDSKDIETVWNKQLKAYLKESEREFCIGILYDTERLYLFRSNGGRFLRYSDEFNTKGDSSTGKDLSLHIPDPYINLPDMDGLLEWTSPKSVDRSKRKIGDLDIISGVHSAQINDAMSSILRVLDKRGMVNQTGYEILIQILSLKIFDEKRNEQAPKRNLDFYVTDAEKSYKTLADVELQVFISRILALREEASDSYFRILEENPLNIKNENHVGVLIEVISQFQDYSFVSSHKTDLYQLVFYKFATPFSKDQNAQFITPLPLIDFLVNIVNPRNGETVIDPTVGIADFLSVSYVNSNSKLDDNNIFGMEIDEQMVMLATLNMLLNGDGNAKLKAKAGYGSILSKFDHQGEILDLIPEMNKKGNWDVRPDQKKLKKFDVVLTNPPFGDDRAFVPKDVRDREVIECYELWHEYGGKKIDLGVIFLENAYRILKPNGRLGIVLSNSIASIDAHLKAREWLLKKLRLVAVFDLPANVFAETGVNTTIMVGYKPESKELEKLKKENYEIFFKAIENVGYEVKTKKRVKVFETKYRLDLTTFEPVIDDQGRAVLLEDFSETISEFKDWCNGQEDALKRLFVEVK